MDHQRGQLVRPRLQEYRNYILGILEEKQQPEAKKTLRVHVRSVKVERRE